MEHKPDNTEEQWLSALAGRVDTNADAQTNLQAQALRRALQAHAEKSESKVPFADQAQYQRLVERLQSEKLLPSQKGWRTSPLWVKTTGALGLSADVIPWRSPVVWGLAATFVIGIAMVVNVQNSAPARTEVDILRGGNATSLIVAEPEVRLTGLVTGLRAAGEPPVVERLKNGSIVLTVAASSKVLDYLNEQRIVPNVVNGNVTLVLMRPQSVPTAN